MVVRNSINFFKNDDELLNYNDKGISLKIGKRILKLLPEDKQVPIVIVCIGTDRSTGDCLGPLVGTFLSEKRLKGFSFYGTLNNPVHALNLVDKINEIYNNYDNPFIISVDACLGRLKNVGTFQINAGPIKPGAAVNKQLPSVGDMHITGVVNVNGFMEFYVLQNTRLSVVMNMAKKIADGIYYANFSYFHNKDWKNVLNQYNDIEDLNF